ncbi:MAG: glucuronate isomerase [Agathobaculum sp.]|jgi:glucuronate isomerase|uniref:glucuronate isomerase n=1 Tax=Agathobaculum sp. TaxID=2048138 RepID=UPI003D94B063
MMKHFITEDFLLTDEPSRRLYHEYAEKMPVFDYHCHLNPKEIYEDRRFSDIGEIWLAGDHYKWRLMRACGVEERYITGDASYREKFERFAAILPRLIGNPLYHWSQLELKRFFGIDTLLDARTADDIWHSANAVLQSEQGSARALIRRSGVRALCTTDDPADDLRYHRLLAEDASFSVRVLPTFRPDRALQPEQADFADYARRLGETAGVSVQTMDDWKTALQKRVRYFAQAGCRASDHSFGSPDFTVWNEKDAERALKSALAGERPTDTELAAYRSAMMDFLGGLYSENGMAMQLHLGAQRNMSARLMQTVGADAGGDAIGDTIVAASVAALLDRLQKRGRLPRTVLYPLNACDNDKLIAAAGSFQDAECPGKIQLGPAWWFNDHFDGMTAQLRSLANIGVLSGFIGMLTDSRSFLSYPRHEYFRRVLCGLVGGWMARGMAPADYSVTGKMVEDICFRNAWSYFRMDA